MPHGIKDEFVECGKVVTSLELQVQFSVLEVRHGAILIGVDIQMQDLDVASLHQASLELSHLRGPSVWWRAHGESGEFECEKVWVREKVYVHRIMIARLLKLCNRSVGWAEMRLRR